MLQMRLELAHKWENFLSEMTKELNGNKAAGTRARKLSLEIEKLLKQYRGRSTGRIEA